MASFARPELADVYHQTHILEQHTHETKYQSYMLYKTEVMLQAFFQVYNEDLEGLIGHQMNWHYPNLTTSALDYDAATGTHRQTTDVDPVGDESGDAAPP